MRQPIRDRPSYRWWALGVVLAGSFSTGFSITILAAVLPRMASDFAVDAATIAWVVTGPLLVVGVMTPTMGKLGDLYGRKRVYLAGFASLIVCTALAAASTSAGQLIALRLLGALGGAAVMPTAVAQILSAFGAEDRVKAMSWWSFIGAGAPVAGLVAGGPLVDAFGWRWIFAVQPVLAVPALVLAWIVLRPDRATERPVFDLPGSATLAAATGAVLFGLNRGGATGWGRPLVVVSLAASPLLFALFAWVERRAAAPLVPLEYLKRRNVVVPLVVLVLSYAPYMGSFFLSPFLLDDLLGYDTTRTTLAILPRPLANSVLSIAAGWICVRIGERSSAVVGMAAMVFGVGMLGLVTPTTGFWLVVAAMVLTGAGHGVSNPGLSSSIANEVSEGDFGTIAAVQSMAQHVGMVAGMQVMQTLQQATEASLGLQGSYRLALSAGAMVCVIAMVLSLQIRSMKRAPAAPVVEPV